MINKYFCLVTVEYADGFQTQLNFGVNAENEDDAEEELEKILQSWNEAVEFFTVEQVTSQKIRLRRFIVHTLDSRNHRKPVREFSLKAVDQKTAETLAAGTISKWADAKYTQIIKVWEIKKADE